MESDPGMSAPINEASAPPLLTPLLNLAPAIEFGEDRRVIRSSPFEIDWQGFKDRHVTDRHRMALASNLLAWLREARSVVQLSHIWIGGSFASAKAYPADVDAVLFFHYRGAAMTAAARDSFLTAHPHVFESLAMKARYGVDGACVALSMPPSRLVQFAAYWAMVYSNGPDGSRRAFYSIQATTFPI